MSTHRRAAVVTASLALSLALALPTQAAIADTLAPDATTSPEVAFHELLTGIDLPPAKKRQIEDYFAALPDDKQEAGIADPSSLFTTSEVSSSVRALPAASGGTSRATTAAASGTRTFQVNNRQEAKIGNVTVATLSLSYTYEARGGAVTRNLGCTGSVSGAISANSSPSSWISQGRGTCEVRTQVSLLFRGVPVQFTKVHTVTTQAGNPARVDGRVYSA